MVQAVSSARAGWSGAGRWLVIITVIAVIGAATALHSVWLPAVQTQFAALRGEKTAEPQTAKPAEPADEHAGHDHKGHSESDSIELSRQARENIGLKVEAVALTNFVRSVSIPGMVVERPGRSTVKVTTPMTGIITLIHPTEGESVTSGQPLFELRLTHEEIVQAQSDLLRTAEELDVVAREIERLEKATANGAIAGKTLLERKYEQQKLEALNRSQQQALLLHGLSAKQVDDIVKDRSLLQKITIQAPAALQDSAAAGKGTKFQIQDISASLGQHVNAGEPLAVLNDYSTLLIEGNAFEAEAALIESATRGKAVVQAIVDREGVVGQRVDGLRILYQGSRINPETRAVHFYVLLPNTVYEEPATDGGRSFLSWQYRPGQRMRLQVPVESLPDRIVLPAAAIAQDGVETYVFTVNGDHFDRRPVHVEFRDEASVVIANDGSVFVGDQVAINGAQQLQLALKNKAGGGVDPHAGHNH